MTTLVTGATGHLGRGIIDAMRARGAEPAGIVGGGRDAVKLAALAGTGIPTVELDYDDPATIVSALQGIDTLMLVSASEPGARVAQHAAVIEVAKHAGVRRIIYTSAPHADTSSLILAPDHRATEQLIRDSGIPFTFLRNNWYSETYAATVERARSTGEVLVSTGDGRVASAA